MARIECHSEWLTLGPVCASETFAFAKIGSMANKSIYDFSAETLDGVTVPLGDFRGKVLLVVNVATF